MILFVLFYFFRERESERERERDRGGLDVGNMWCIMFTCFIFNALDEAAGCSMAYYLEFSFCSAQYRLANSGFRFCDFSITRLRIKKFSNWNNFKSQIGGCMNFQAATN